MEKHRMAGLPVKITNGPFKDQYFIVVDYMVNQYQGKSIERIYKSHPALIHPVKVRMKQLDDQIVFGKLHPSMEFCCMHDSELRVMDGLRITKDIDKLDLPDNVVDIKQGAKDVSTGPSTSDSEPVEPGESEPDGRSIPSNNGDGEAHQPVEVKGQDNSEAGSPSGGSKKRSSRPKK